ncbi:hypothetical protein GIB67_003255 [Kingdonia uniflora]|uniref:Uncharacterized protein n=1 Tax=Kingdonia uniflora TaxID=39325 RepID=A0A7J7LXM9_9MAGN|nr:hypothetical protein GIB67_003255 [Kingdonia uniflora]
MSRLSWHVMLISKTQVLTVFSYLVQSFLNLNTAEGSQQLEERIWGLLQKKILKAKKIPEGEDIQISTLESILKKSLKLATKPIKKKSATNSSNIKQLAFVSRQKKIFSLSQQSTYWVLKIVHARSLPESEKQRILDIFQLALMEFFVSKKSRLKPGFIKEVFQRQPWIGLRLFDFLLQKCRSVKSEFRRVDGVDMVEGILKFSVSSGEEKDAASERLKSHITPLTDLISKLVIDMPKKKLWRSQAFRFCGQAFKAIKALNLIKEFLEALTSEAYDACELQLGDIFHKFLPLNKPEKSTGTTKLKKSTETMKPDKSINKIKPKKSTDEKKSKKKIGREK